MPTAKQELKTIPGFSQGVKESAALRMITMARPICPHSKITMELDSNGRPVPIKTQGPANCQLETEPRWWERCEERGHDPYFTTHKWYTTEDILETDDKGRLIKKGEQLLPHEERRLNTVQVGAAININNGTGPRESMEKKGFRLLGDFGYIEVCQYRNCQKPVVPEGISRKYGRYCSKEHLSWIGAMVETDEGEPLDITDARLAGFSTHRAHKRRERRYREVLLGA